MDIAFDMLYIVLAGVLGFVSNYYYNDIGIWGVVFNFSILVGIWIFWNNIDEW